MSFAVPAGRPSLPASTCGGGHHGLLDHRLVRAWDGATAARDRVIAMLRSAKNPNPVVLAGDAHMDLALDVKENAGDPKSAIVAAEFLTTSLSSGGDGTAVMPNADRILADNPHLHFVGNRRGYTRHVVTPKRWQADLRTLAQISTPGAPVTTAKSFVVEAGRPGLVGARAAYRPCCRSCSAASIGSFENRRQVVR